MIELHVCVLSSANLSRVVPHGLLVFFSSFTLMDKNLEFWRVSGCFKPILNWMVNDF